MSEHVLVISEALAKDLAPKVYGPVQPNTEARIMQAHSFLEREAAEKDFSHKQVIPYIVVTHNSDYLLTQRTSEQQEVRLHNKYSIGQGGHLNELDFSSGSSPIINGLMREIREEFELGPVMGCTPVGVINDDSNEVGRVHLGLVYLMTVKTPHFQVAEKGKHTAQWAGPAKLWEHYTLMENWSKILMDHIFNIPH